MRDAGTVERLDLGSEVELTHLRHQMTFSGSLELTSETGEVRSFFGEGTGSQQELDLENLSSIVEVLNDRFGTDLSEVDKLLLDQFEEDWVADDELSDQAKSNSLDNFGLAFNRKFLNTIIARVDTNDEIFKKILDDEEFKSAVEGYYLRKVYSRLRETSLPE
jgi:type I restriction enzyme R subunit